MKLHAAIAGYQTDIQIREEHTRVFAEVDGRYYELEVRESGHGYLLIEDGRVFDCRVESPPESGKKVDVMVGPATFAVTLTDPKRWRGTEAMSAHADEAAHIIAPMPGKVVKVLVAIGEQIEAGAAVAIVEAMKMQNELKSPKGGTVASINVEVGTTVNGGGAPCRSQQRRYPPPQTPRGREQRRA